MSKESAKDGAGVPPLSAQDALEFMQKMWNPFAMPMPGSATGAVAPTQAPPGAADTPSQPAAPASAPSGMPGMLAFPNPAAMFAALDPAHVERKISELKIVEGWLAMSLDLTRMSIKTLELQHASLAALQANAAPQAKAAGKSRKR
jgi:hypothetical protein